MTLYMLFAGLGTSVYIGLVDADATFFRDDSPMFAALLSNVVAALLLLCAYRVRTIHLFNVALGAAWERRIVVAVIAFKGALP